MTTIEKIRAEIERRITDNTFGAKLELIDILAWLDTLESEKTISLWKKIHTYTEEIHEGDMEKMLLELSVGKGEKRTKTALPDRIVDILESEKPMNQDGLREEINKAMKSDLRPEEISDYDFCCIARHFAEWGYLRAAEKYDEIEYNRQRAEESVPKDLEEAAKDYTDSSEWLIGENLEHIDDAFIAGAKWQAEQLLKSSPLPEDTVLFNKGVEEGRRLAEEEQADLFTIVALDAAQRAKEQMMKEAVEGEITKDNRGNNVVRTGVFNNGFEIGDKVCIIIVKE